MEGKAVFGGGQGKAGEADNKLNIDSIIARLLEGRKIIFILRVLCIIRQVIINLFILLVVLHE